MKPGTTRLRKAAKGEPKRVAVVDCGTSEVRTYIAELQGARQRILEDLHHPIDLTAAFTSERLDREAMDTVVQAFEAVVAAAEAYGVSQLRAVGTSALREAVNADVLIERIRQKAGVDVETIDSAEESRLYFEALRVLLERTGRTLSGTVLLLDVGGGGTTMALIQGDKLLHSVDEHFGTLRVTELFHDLSDAGDWAVTIDRYSLGAAKMMLSRLPEARPDTLVVTGGDVRRLLALVRGGARGAFEELPAQAVEEWFRKVVPMTPLARAEACGADVQSAALLMPAGALLRHLCAFTGVKTMLVPQLTLRDGLLADLLPGAHGPHHFDTDQLIAEAQQLARRYGSDAAYAENTASLAVQIFEQTAELHGLSDRHRTLLHFSALVHDIGSYINVRNRHKHTMYIIQAADIPGLTRTEKEMVAHIARYHRRSAPQPHHSGFQALPRRSRVVVSYLAAILRLAYGLDVERSQRIRKVRCEVAEGRLLIHVDRRQVALERWSIGGKAQMFEDVFGLTVAVVPREEE